MPRIIKPVAAAALAIGLAVGVPALLVSTVGNPLPTQIPTLDEITSTLSQTGQGFTEVLIAVLAIFIWLIWAQLIVALAVEVAAVSARKQTRRLPVLPGLQTFAARLVAALTLTATLAAGPMSALAGAAAYSVTPNVTALVVEPTVAPRPELAPVVGVHVGGATAEPTLTLAETADLWGLAEQLYGDGAQWRTIVATNTGRSTANGHLITADTATLPAGTVIALTGSADLAAAARVGQLDTDDTEAQADLAEAIGQAEAGLAADPDNQRTVTVTEGDTLWGITQTALHDDLGRSPSPTELGAEVAVVVETNIDSLRSGDPDLIYPGEIIVLGDEPLLVWTADATPGLDTGDHAALDDAVPAGGFDNLEAQDAAPFAELNAGDLPAAAEDARVGAGSGGFANLDVDDVTPASESAATSQTDVAEESGSGVESVGADPAVAAEAGPSPAAAADQALESVDAGAGGVPQVDVDLGLDAAGGVASAGRPPSGLFFGQFLAGAQPPAPPAGAEIDIDAFASAPPVEATAQESPDDAVNGWDPPTTATDSTAAPTTDPAATPSRPVPLGAPVQPETTRTFSAEELAPPAGSRTVTTINWTVLLAALPLLGGGIWAALGRRRRLKAARRPSRYAAMEIGEVETAITDALAGSPALGLAAKIEALSALIARWVPLDAPSLVAVTVDDDTVTVLWDADLAPEPVGDPASVRVDRSQWLIDVEDLVSAIDTYPTHGLPALVHIGQTPSGADLFLNLEELGRLNLTGDPRAVERFSGRLAMELALSPLFSLGTLVLVGFGRQLAAIDNIEHYASSDDALRALAPRLPSLQRALATDSALQLRAAGRLDSDISPIVVIDLSDTAPNPELVAAANATIGGGLCILHGGDTASAWPLRFDDHDNVHVGGTLDITVVSNEPDEQTIAKIVAMVAADIDYQPADTIEGAISDTLTPTHPHHQHDDDDVDDGYRAQVVSIEHPEPDTLDTDEWLTAEGVIDEWLIDPADDDDAAPAGFGEDHVAAVEGLVVWPDPEPLPSPTGVRLRILGTVRLEGVEFSRKAVRYLELVALMMARGGKITVTEISTHMFNSEGSVAAIHALLTRTRKALGETADGQPRLSFETPTGQYELVDVSSDYHQILDVCKQIKNDDTLTRDQACQLMDSAAQLIDGPPYAAAGESFDWVFTAGQASQAVLAADSLCRELGAVYTALGNYTRARWSIRQGLKACPACDELYEALIAVVAKDGTSSDLKALWAEIEASYDAAGLEVPLSLAEAYGYALAA